MMDLLFFVFPFSFIFRIFTYFFIPFLVFSRFYSLSPVLQIERCSLGEISSLRSKLTSNSVSQNKIQDYGEKEKESEREEGKDTERE